MVAGRHLSYDWHPGLVPDNVVTAENVFLESAYAFGQYFSEQPVGLEMGHSSGAYDRTTFIAGPKAKISVGAFTILNGTFLVCHDRISIGAHCLLSWGVVITDTYLPSGTPVERRREALVRTARDPRRMLPPIEEPRAVRLEDNVWVGFDSVILPGVTLGRGCVIGAKTVIADDVPPYAVVVGEPPRIIRYLEPDDTAAGVAAPASRGSVAPQSLS